MNYFRNNTLAALFFACNVLHGQSGTPVPSRKVVTVLVALKQASEVHPEEIVALVDQVVYVGPGIRSIAQVSAAEDVEVVVSAQLDVGQGIKSVNQVVVQGMEVLS